MNYFCALNSGTGEYPNKKIMGLSIKNILGLDMYLIKKTYNIPGNDPSKPIEFHWPDEYISKVEVELNGKPHPDIDSKRIGGIIEVVGYWRKANHIHIWFVNNVQQGKDDFKEYPVSKVQLTELYKLCQRVLDRTIDRQTFLPTRGGYPFDSIEYEANYENECRRTTTILEPLINEKEETYYYESYCRQ